MNGRIKQACKFSFLLWVVLFSILFIQAKCRTAQTPKMAIPTPPAGVDNLNPFLENILKRYELPGIVAAVFDSGGLVSVGAAGTRKIGSGVPLIYSDKIQIASIAKTMTATITARLIDAGHLKWETSLIDVYPELATKMDPSYHTVTIEMLLRHTAGIPQWMKNDLVFKAWVKKHEKLDASGKRYEAVKHILTQRPEYSPGSKYYYTNDSYLIIGNICERKTGKSFERLLSEYIFLPLGMSSCGFGEPWADGTINQPWGHEKKGSRFIPYGPDPNGYGNIPFGTCYGAIVHSSVVDLAKYGTYHLRGDLDLEKDLASSTFRRLHHAAAQKLEPATQISANGFFNEGKIDSNGYWSNVQHWGYYARGRTLLWYSPQANVGAVILTNGTDEDEVKGMQPISYVVIELFKKYRRDAER